MNNRQKILIISPLVIVLMMVPAFQFLGKTLGDTIGWYIGLCIYWIIWGIFFPWLMIGKDKIFRLIQPQIITWKLFFLVLFPIVLAAIFRFSTGMEYTKPAPWVLIMLISTNLGNGIFEEILWRGTYLELFPEKVLFRIIWSSIWFGLWHYAPGSISSTGNPIGLIIGSLFFGFYLGFLAHKTDTIWWNVLAHTLGGFVMVF